MSDEVVTRKELIAVQKKVERALDYWIKKIHIDYAFKVEKMSDHQISKAQKQNFFTIERTHRNSEDKKQFLIEFNPIKLKEVTLKEMKCHLFHEVLHALKWGYVDEQLEVIKHIRNKSLKRELEKRMHDMDENITYDLERKLGPLIAPHLKTEWSKFNSV